MQSFGPDSKQSWVVALSCFFIQIMSSGLSEVSGLFFVATIPRFKTKRLLASLPYTLSFSVRCALGPLIGFLGCRYGIRQVTLAGCVLSAISVGACFFVEDIIPLIILWGIGFGFSLGLETSLLSVILNEHFVKNRVMANGLNVAGASIGNMILTPLIVYLLEAYGISGAFLIVSGFMLHNIPAAIVIMFNKLEPRRVDKPIYTPDMESVLKVRTFLAPAIEVVREFSNTDSISKSLHNPVLYNEGINENDVHNSYDNAKPSLILMPKVLYDDFPNERNFSYSYSDEETQCFKSGDDMSVVTKFQTEIDRVNDECDKLRSIVSGNNCRKSLFPDPNQLEVISDNEAKKNFAEQSNRRNSKTVYLDSMTSRIALENGPNIEVTNKELSVKLNRKENQSIVTSPSDLSEVTWKNDESCVYNHLEMQYNSSQKNLKRNPSTDISNGIVSSENERRILSPSGDKIENNSKWQIYRLACEPVYLLLLVSSGIYYFSVTTFLTIIVDYAMDNGFPMTYSTYILIWAGVWDLVAYPTLGFIMDRGYFTQTTFACLSYLGMCLTTAAMVWAPSYIVLLVIIVIFEFSQAGVIILASPLVAELIDPDLQATAIASLTLLSAPVNLAISPLIGLFRDVSGSYTGLFYVISGSSFLSCLLFLCIPKVKRHLKA